MKVLIFVIPAAEVGRSDLLGDGSRHGVDPNEAETPLFQSLPDLGTV